MVILERPYASDFLLGWLSESGHPVLDNSFAREVSQRRGLNLNLVAPADAVDRLNRGERVFTNCEDALAWILDNVENPALVEPIRLFKDKAAMRQLFQQLDPDYFFGAYDLPQLRALDFEAQLAAHVPFVVKPSVGFCSVGVYVVNNASDWQAALAAIDELVDLWSTTYPEGVVNAHTFLIEQYITGQEYAIDAYFDEAGRTVVLDVLQHDFASPEDTSDKLYMTSPRIMTEMAPRFAEWLDQVNQLVGARSFPVHVEVRVGADGRIRPIEFNPLRFAGLGGTDISKHAYGFLTYQAFLENAQIDWPAAFAGKEGEVFSMSFYVPGDAPYGRFDYDAFGLAFPGHLELRPLDVEETGAYAFLFMATPEADPTLRQRALTVDVQDFVSPFEE
ncbi:MAG: ATP-grasp domain-containing protein [Eggerthellaceae bacterium]|nr:ATP-grasp domain-containing protein [Eggerthellaceae bacterium]